MPEFAWRAARADGQIVDGRLSAESDVLALRQLRERGLTPIRIDTSSEAVVGVPSKSGASIFGALQRRREQGPVNRADVLSMTSELAIMLRAGLPLDNALKVLIEMTQKPALRDLQQQLLVDVKGGQPFSRALAREQKLFGDFYVSMVRSGEASGHVPLVMERLVEHMERLRALRDSVISATIYPAILLAVAALSVMGMLGFVVPQFEKLFSDMGDALPMPTRIIMALGHGFRSYGLVLGILLVGGAWLALRWLRSPAGALWLQTRLLGLPLIGPLLHKYNLTLFSRSLGTLLGNGVPMVSALQIATDTVGNPRLRGALASLVPAVKEGGKLATAMQATRVFEPLAINLVRVGEETGRAGPMMLELAAVLDRDVEIGIKRTLTFVEPALILVLGVLIAAIIVSILLGILAINQLAV